MLSPLNGVFIGTGTPTPTGGGVRISPAGDGDLRSIDDKEFGKIFC